MPEDNEKGEARPSTTERKAELDAYADAWWAIAHKDKLGGLHIAEANKLVKHAGSLIDIHNIVEIGALYGAYIRQFLRPTFPGARIVGVDLMEPALEYAQQQGDATYVIADLDEGIPLAPNAYDLVVAIEVLEHLHDLDTCLAGVRRILRHGGALACTMPVDHYADGVDHHVFLSAVEWVERIQKFLAVDTVVVFNNNDEIAILARRTT